MREGDGHLTGGDGPRSQAGGEGGSGGEGVRRDDEAKRQMETQLLLSLPEETNSRSEI